MTNEGHPRVFRTRNGCAKRTTEAYIPAILLFAALVVACGPHEPQTEQDTVDRTPSANAITWRMGKQGASCIATCQAHNQKCSEQKLREVDTAPEVQAVARRANARKPCKSTYGWQYATNPGQCTASSCCGGRCIGACTYGTGANPTCGASSGPYSRYCPCESRACVPSCNGRQCGSDGCGGSCGRCQGGQACSNGKCVDTGPPGNSPCGSYVGQVFSLYQSIHHGAVDVSQHCLDEINKYRTQHGLKPYWLKNDKKCCTLEEAKEAASSQRHSLRCSGGYSQGMCGGGRGGSTATDSVAKSVDWCPRLFYQEKPPNDGHRRAMMRVEPRGISCGYYAVSPNKHATIVNYW